MTLRELEYFVKAVELGNLTKASRALYVSQPTISLAIQRLENEYDTVFFDKKGSVLSLTEEGHVFYEMAKEILGKVKEKDTQMKDFVRNNVTLRIGVPPMLGAFLFPTALDEFQRKNPSVRMMTSEYGSAANQKAVLDGEIDVALTVLYKDRKLESLDYVYLGRTELLYAVGKHSPLASYDYVTLKEISKSNFILLREDSLQYKIVNDIFKENNLPLHISFSTNQLYTIKEMLLLGSHAAFLFNQVIRKDTDIVGVRLENSIPFDIVAAYPHSSKNKPIVKKFLDFIQTRKKAFE